MMHLFCLTTFGSFASPPLNSLCVDKAGRGLHPCLANSCRLPVMISVAPHNEVQAWIRLGDDRGVGVALLLSGAARIHCHSATLLCYDCWRKMCVPSTSPLFTLWLAVCFSAWWEWKQHSCCVWMCVCVHVCLQRPAVAVQFGFQPVFGLCSSNIINTSWCLQQLKCSNKDFITWHLRMHAVRVVIRHHLVNWFLWVCI